MRRRGIAALVLTWSALAGGVVYAGDVYVVRFSSEPSFAEPPCTYLSYRDDLVFFNSSEGDAIVSLVDVSNGAAVNPQPLTIEAGKARSSEGGDSSAASTWAPDPRPQSGLWVARIDVPEEVEVVSRLLVRASRSVPCNNGFPGGWTHTYAGIAMPVVRALTAPGVSQVHLGTDIGGDIAGSDDGRTNIGVYNAGSTTALATAELRRACDGSLLERRAGFIPPNTIIQLNNFSSVFTGCSAIRTAPYETYVVVTVDQPSFSYVVTLSNQRPPWIPVSSSP